jgi:hypothetical protein
MVNIYYLRWLARLSRDVKDVKDVKLGYQFTDDPCGRVLERLVQQSLQNAGSASLSIAQSDEREI